MNRKYLITIARVLLCFFSVGCDKLCKKTVEDVVSIQNTTGRALSVYVCKGRTYGEVIISVSQDANFNEVSLGTREDSEVKGGPTASCSGVSGGKTTMGISLSQNSFGQVKLCFDDINKRNVIVENNQSCPTGLVEQISTGPCIY